jgi:heptosyltransferase-2
MNTILVIQTASIGDVILATSLPEKLHKYFPGSRIDFLVKKGMEGLFHRHPYLNNILLWDKKKKYRDLIRILTEIRKTRYDLVVNVQRFALTGLLTVLSGSAMTIGFDKNPLSLFFTRRVRHRIALGVHEIARNQALIAGLTDEAPEKPRLYPCQMLDAGSSIQHPASSIYYTLSPASLWFTKQFPAERWTELIRHIPEDRTVFLLGSKSDVELCEQIRQDATDTRQKPSLSSYPVIQSSSHPSLINLAGKLSFLESAALMQGARMNFTNDSAPMHLASAVNAPVTVVFCSTVPEFGFGPLSGDSRIVEVRDKLACRPCGLHGKRSCPEDHFDCAWKIDVSELINAI